MKRNTLRHVAALLLIFALRAGAQGTAFTYQGLLNQAGAPANGVYDLSFTLYAAESGGLNAGTTNFNDLAITNGLLNVTLDFGDVPFIGADRWLEIGVRPGASSGAYTNLAPRQPVNPTPYAIFSRGVNSAGIIGQLTDSQLSTTLSFARTFSNPGNVFFGNGANLTALNASQLTSGTVADARLSANVALRAGGNTFNGNQGFNSGNLSLVGSSTFEFGAGVAGKESNAGKIGYATFTPGALDIVGAGTNFNGRTVQLWDQVHVGNYNADGSPKLISFGDPGYVSIGENGDDDQMELTAGKFVFNNGNVGIATTNPATRLTVNQPGYGIEHTDGSVRLSTYVQSDGAYFGTVTPHPLYLMINDNSGAMVIYTNNNTEFFGEITATAVNITSDRNAKEQFKLVNARDVLDKVARLPISEWQYKTQGDARHIGPMAQDFHAAFAVGRDDKHITSVDADGVALAAIQGLNEKFEEQTRAKDARIQQLEATVEELKALVGKLAAQQKGGGR